MSRTDSKPTRREDAELNLYRDLLDVPKEFRDGFGWTTVVGILFCGLIMLPGSIYLGLMTGGGFGAVASWVTVILFSEVTRRALKTMSKQELVILLYAANIMIAANALMPGGPFGQLVWRAFMVGSDAMRDAGIAASIPAWWAPPAESEAVARRSLFHKDWLIPITIMVFITITGTVNRYTLGYVFFRLTSDVEKLPFPLAPINAQGAMALAEETETPAADPAADDGVMDRAVFAKVGQKKSGQKWRLFSLGATVGLVFGFFQVGVPALTGLILDKPIFLIPQPWIETTPLTEGVLPATPTGLTFDLGIVLMGMIIPFWAAVGSFVAIALTLIFNPILHRAGVLQQWQPGMDTINTIFANQVDFYLAFGIGMGLGMAAVSFFSTGREVVRQMRVLRAARRAAGSSGGRTGSVWTHPHPNRGDFPMWLCIALYLASSLATIGICWILLPKNTGVLVFLFFFCFVYNPLISYVNARLLGISGQQVDIPFIKETSFLLSGAKGVEIWLAPIPIENYALQAQGFRVNELTGVNFRSLLKTDLVATPLIFLLSFLFWAFVWHSNKIPSEAFPFAQKNWELMSKQMALQWSSTHVAPGEDPATKSIADSQFFRAAWKPPVIAGGAAFTIVGFSVLSLLGLPVLLVYGLVRGLGGIPHMMILEITGALIGRFYFQRRFGRKEFLRMGPTILAGYFTGVGLISMATIALTLIKQAVSGRVF